MIEQNFKSQRYELKQFKGEHIEVAFAGNMMQIKPSYLYMEQ